MDGLDLEVCKRTSHFSDVTIRCSLMFYFRHLFLRGVSYYSSGIHWTYSKPCWQRTLVNLFAQYCACQFLTVKRINSTEIYTLSPYFGLFKRMKILFSCAEGYIPLLYSINKKSEKFNSSQSSRFLDSPLLANFFISFTFLASSAGAAEYTDCISTEG